MATMIATSMVATRPKATGNGPYLWPNHSVMPTPITNWANTDTSGDRHLLLTWAKTEGRSRIRPMAYQVRVVAFAAAFEFAMAELAMARKTTTHPAPHTDRAIASHGLPP